jgi:MFS family permease
MLGFTEAFMIPYGLALGASHFQVGLLSSVRNLILSLVQLKTADATRWFRSRRRLVVTTAALQALFWVPIALVPWIFETGAVPALIALYTAGTAIAAFGGPAWGSLVSEYLAPGERGRFFGRLTRAGGVSKTAAGLAAGGVLSLFSGSPLVGFALLCAAAAASRVVSAVWLSRLPEGPWSEDRGERFSFWQFVRQAPTSNFARFSLCIGVLSFAVNIAAPYVAVYLLQELHFGYLAYTVTVESGAAAAFLTASRWGRVADRSGNWVVLRLAMLGVSVVPALWGLSGATVWMLAVYTLSGLLWGGFNLAVVNYVYDAATPTKRARCLAYFNVINGCGVSLGALTGGWMLGWMPPVGGSGFVSLFLVSAGLRLVVALAFPRLVREVREVHPTGLRQVVYDLVGQRLVAVLGLLPPWREGNGSRQRGEEN